MVKKHKLIILGLFVFSFGLSLNNQSKIEKVSASGELWQSVTTIESGKEYLITATLNGTTYYLPTGSFSTAPDAQVADLTKSNSNLWTFTSREEGGYTIHDEEGNYLVRRNGPTLLLTTNPPKFTNDTYFYYWYYTAEYKLQTDSTYRITLDELITGSTSTIKWFPKESGSDTVTTITLYEPNTAVITETSSFVDSIMSKESGDIVTPQCHTKYSEAKTNWNHLSVPAQELFKNDEAYTDAQSRLTMWAIANGESIEEFYNNEVEGLKAKESNNTPILIIISALFLLSTLSLAKKRIAKEKLKN